MPHSQLVRWGVAISSLLVAIATARILFAPMALVMPALAHYLPEAPVALFAHIVFASLALGLMPLQFWSGLRAMRPRLHRWIGYGYVSCVVISGLGALALLPEFLGTRFAALGLFLLALIWIFCTARAVFAARSGDFVAHRRWMIRSAALSFAAVTLRLQLPLVFAAGYDLPGAYSLLAWDSWLPNLLVAEIYLKTKKARPAARPI